MPTTSTSEGKGIQVQGLTEFRRELKALGAQWPKELTVINKTVATKAAAWAVAEAQAMGGMQARAARAIRGKANMRQATIGITPGKGAPMANAAFWGAKRHTGWYGNARHASATTPQFPEWVGNSWDVAKRGQGPYAINDALADHLTELDEIFNAGIADLTSRAFPD